MVTRSKLGIVKPNPKYALNTSVLEVTEPSTVKEDLGHSGCLKDMQEELAALDENHTWA